MPLHSQYLAILSVIEQRYAEKGNIGRLRKAEQAIWFADRLTLHLYSGGFQEYFFAYDGRFVWKALWALETIKAPKTAELLRQAIQVYPILSSVRDEELRQMLLLDLPILVEDRWLVLDARFLNSSEIIASRVVRYAQQQRIFAHIFGPTSN